MSKYSIQDIHKTEHITFEDILRETKIENLANMNLGQAVRFIRKKQSLTQVQLAQAANVSQMLIVRLEKNDTGVTLDKVYKVLEVLNLNLLVMPLSVYHLNKNVENDIKGGHDQSKIY